MSFFSVFLPLFEMTDLGSSRGAQRRLYNTLELPVRQLVDQTVEVVSQTMNMAMASAHVSSQSMQVGPAALCYVDMTTRAVVVPVRNVKSTNLEATLVYIRKSMGDGVTVSIDTDSTQQTRFLISKRMVSSSKRTSVSGILNVLLGIVFLVIGTGVMLRLVGIL